MTRINRILAVLATFLLIFQVRADNTYGLPENIQEGNILHCFNWTYQQIQDELPNIAKAGFTAVQVSPTQGSCSTGAEWYYAYLPYDLSFVANGTGTKAQLKELCTAAHSYGVKIIVDVVANHVNPASGYHHSWWDANGRVRWGGGIDYSDRNSITHDQLGSYGDVNSEDYEVQQRALSFIYELKGSGVDGIRWDAAKHIGLPSEGCNFWNTVTATGLYNYGEILDSPGGNNASQLMKEYTGYMSVTDNGYCKGVLNAVKNGSVTSGYGGWSAGGVASNKIVYWAESHDTYSNENYETTYVPQDQIDRAWAIIACRAGESSLYLSRPSKTTYNEIRMGVKGSTHALEAPEIAAVNHFRNAAAGTRDYYVGANGVATITREGFGACIVVGNGQSKYVSVENGGSYCPAGTYVDKVSGNEFTVTDSKISGTVGNSGIAVIYNKAEGPSLTLNPNGGTFDKSVEVMVTLDRATSAWYQVGNGEKRNITGTDIIYLGEDMADGESVTVTWEATDGTTTNSGSAVFTRSDTPENAIYFDNSASSWADVYVHHWGSNDSSWPGKCMEKIASSDHIYKYVCPEGTTGLVFNNNNKGSQTADLTFQRGHIYNHQQDLGEYSGAETPNQFFIIGDLSHDAWNPATALKLTRKGNTYKSTSVELVASSDQISSFFSFLTYRGSDWTSTNKYDRYGAESKDYVLKDGIPAKMVKFEAEGQNTARMASASSTYSWKLAPGTYLVKADFDKMTVMAAKITSVESLYDSSADYTPEYYTLQGVKIKTPQKGIIYIVKRGAKVTKELY